MIGIVLAAGIAISDYQIKSSYMLGECLAVWNFSEPFARFTGGNAVGLQGIEHYKWLHDTAYNKIKVYSEESMRDAYDTAYTMKQENPEKVLPVEVMNCVKIMSIMITYDEPEEEQKSSL